MKILGSKKVLLSLLVVFIIETGWAIWYLRSAKQETGNRRQEISEIKSSISLSLNPLTGKFPADKEFSVAIVLSTGQKPTVGADAILEYDPEKLEIVAVVPGEIFDFYPLLKTEEKKVLISAVSQGKKTFSGQGILAQLTLKGKNPGEAKLRFNFEKGETIDSNVAIENKVNDGLEEVKNASYTFE